MALEDVYRRNLSHRTHRAGWLRAAVLGANDGLVSTASLMIGVTAAKVGGENSQAFLVAAGVAGIVAGAMSMAVGEYVSVRSQNEIYVKRGLSPELALEVATQMHARDALEAHLRDELGQHPHTKARPIQAAIASAAAFTSGGLIPFAGAFAPTTGTVALSIIGFTVMGLMFTGITSAKIAGSKILTPTIRVILGGCLGMAITAVIGSLLHVSGI
jgi:VIT1/CCC1 family predicted Fe2+/Mn2+ transporter